jgi:hypothetical protein
VHATDTPARWCLGGVAAFLCCGARGSGVSSERQKYLDYARECVRLAGHAEAPELRDELIELARVWMDAAMAEEEAESERPRPLPPQTTHTTQRPR